MMPEQELPTSVASTTATPVFDPRFNRLLLNFTYLHHGSLPGSRDATFRVANGEGEVWLDPAETPTIGVISQGKLVIASESFPRYAPLTMTLTGADLGFHVRQGRVISFSLVERGDMLFRLLCTSPWQVAYRHELYRMADNQLVLSRFNQADDDRMTSLEINVLKGASPSPITGRPGGGRVDPVTKKVLLDKVMLRRADDGELKLQLHGARMEWEFAQGIMTALRLYDSRGKIGAFNILAQAGAGVATTATFLDTLP